MRRDINVQWEDTQVSGATGETHVRVLAFLGMESVAGTEILSRDLGSAAGWVYAVTTVRDVLF